MNYLITLAETASEANWYTAEAAKYIAIGIMLLVMSAVSIGEAWVCASGVKGVSRNPEATSKIRSTMIIGTSLVETCAIYTLVLVILLIFVANPATAAA